MRSYLLSALAQRFARGDVEGLKTAYPNDWLVWEPGVWRPPAHQTLVVPAAKHPPVAHSGEALAYVLPARPQITVGRGVDCDIAINDATLSHLHLVLMNTGDAWTVRDAGSRNGTWVDGVALLRGLPVPLKAGSSLRAGEVSLSFYDSGRLFERLKAG